MMHPAVDRHSSFRALPLANPDLTLYLSGAESVLYSARSQSLYGLDALATYVLLALDRGMSADAVKGALADRCTPAALAPVLESFGALLAGGADDTAGGYGAVRSELPAPPVADADRTTYELMGTRFLLRLPDARTEALVRPWLSHLRQEGGAVDIVVNVVRHGGRYQPSFNGVPHGEPLAADRLFPVLLDRMRSLAYQGTDYLLAVHGAVVAKWPYGLLLPGESGSGKSTLTAMLVANGFALLTDETAVLDRRTQRVLPVPLPIGLKAGSWSEVRPRFQDFDAQEVHERWDGLQLRYLLPSTAELPTAGAALSHVVFPKYEPGAATTLAPVSAVEALRRMTAGGYQVKDRLDTAKVEELLRWLSQLRCYSLRYGSTAGALNGIVDCLDVEAIAA